MSNPKTRDEVCRVTDRMPAWMREFLADKGIEYLRGIYATSGLSIKPKTRVSKLDALKEIIRAWGLNPEEILTRDALTKPHATIISREQVEESQLHQLSKALKQQLLKEMRDE